MRVAILGDVHGNVLALRRVLQHLRRQSADLVVNLGDCLSAPLWPQETFEELQSLDAVTVRGNHDRWLGEAAEVERSATVAFTAQALSENARAWAESLPASRLISPDIFAVHGRPDSDMAYLLEDEEAGRLTLATTATLSDRLHGVHASLLLCGHSHLQHAAWASGGRLVVNPGSVGCPRYAGNVDALANEAGSPHARYAVATREHGSWSVEFFALAYDWSPVVRRASALNRDDWAAAFFKGAST